MSAGNTDQNKFKKIPSFVFNLDLTTLNFAHNEITTLQNEVGNFKRINNLDLSYNDIRRVPSSIGNLTSLSYLYFDRNRNLKIKF